MARQIALQRAWLIISDVDLASGEMIVRQLHTIIEVFSRAADVQNVHESGMTARDRLKCRHAFELAEKRALAFECAAINNFNCAQRAGDSSRHPDLAVSAVPDHAQRFVIGNNWDFRGNLVRNEFDFTQVPRAKQLRSPDINVDPSDRSSPAI